MSGDGESMGKADLEVIVSLQPVPSGIRPALHGFDQVHNPRVLILCAIAIVNFLPCGCTGPSQNLPETVMTNGTVIVAQTALGSIEVAAGDNFDRTYKWDNCVKTVTLRPREERWNGSLGIYYPGSGITWIFGCNGIHRAVVEEGQQHFNSIERALAWIRSPKGMDCVYNAEGLVVCWYKYPRRSQINVQVWQILVNGRTPQHLAGAQSDRIAVNVVR